MAQAGRPKKKPEKRRDARIQLYLTQSKKEWIQRCAEGKNMSMSHYIEMLIDGQQEASDRAEFASFLHVMKKSLKRIRRTVENGSSPAVVNGFVDAAIQRINKKGRDLFRVKNGPPAAGEDE